MNKEKIIVNSRQRTKEKSDCNLTFKIKENRI